MYANPMSAERAVREIFSMAGIGIDTDAPGDLIVKDPRFYRRLLRDASIGLGESYMEGWWECERLDLFIEKVLRGNLRKKIRGNWRVQILTVRALLSNLQSRARAYDVAHKHYDLGNDLFEVMLDKRMIYTCAYWKGANTLDEAQEHKLDLVCKKVGLKPGMKVLDLGCGWGGFAMFAAERYGCEVLGVTVSKEQQAWGQARATKYGLPVEIRVQDYRDVYGSYDAVVSIGLCEHVGWKNHRHLMQVVHRNLRDEAIALIHTVGNNESLRHGVPFMEKHVFPNAVAPSVAQLGRAMEGLFVLEDWHNFGPDYYTTLMAWWDNFAKHYAELDQKKYDEAFYRMWRFYLFSAGGSALARDGNLWQLVLTKQGRSQPECRFS